MRHRRVFAALALLLAACAGTPGPTVTGPASPRATSSPVPTTSPTPEPTPGRTAGASPTASPATPSPAFGAGPAPASLPRTASAERDGVRVRITLDRNPMPAGEVTRITTTVRNLGSDTLFWFSDGCAIPVQVSGRMETAWRPGIEQPGQGGEFKQRVLGLFLRDGPPPGPVIDFLRPDQLGRGAFGCGDIGMTHRIRPGASIREVRAWDGAAALRWGPPPTGPVTLTGTFAWYWRGRGMDDMPEHDRAPRLTATLEAWVVDGADETWLSPPEVVDAALADPAFRAWLGTVNLGSGNSEVLWYRPSLGAWEVGAIAWREEQSAMHLVHVDPRTGSVLRTVDRPWDPERDGVP